MSSEVVLPRVLPLLAVVKGSDALATSLMNSAVMGAEDLRSVLGPRLLLLPPATDSAKAITVRCFLLSQGSGASHFWFRYVWLERGMSTMVHV
jgi:hypothetical protein